MNEEDLEGLGDDFGELADLLADPSLWVEPPADLEDRVVAAVSSNSPISAGRQRRDVRRWLLPFVVGAAAASLAVGVVVASTGESAPSSDATVALTVGPAAPSGVSAGVAELRVTPSGLRIELSAASLPGLFDGAVYQCWVKTAAGLQTCGAFHSGGTDIVLWSGVRDLGAVQAISITLEPAGDEDPASSGQRVLFGTIEPASS